ncbi:DUF4476 domain-containing protein [Flavobacterium ardleyense]|uniref:DUF4476 domain-containing protein n=1 Tax=Flavobacterium ardleyense TaxID=2038737 RepID=UPI00298C89C6|nr:DUF4476 domain-containing protein [Flavobacterium ardleyense]
MKANFTILLAFFSLGIFAQEAGKVGELIKNEAKTSEMQTEQANRRPNSQGAQTANGKRPKSNRPVPQNNNDYRWNFNYGNSEVFLRIPEYGRFTVEIGDQIMSNESGKFRFFDLKGGSVPIAIYDENFLIYRTRIVLRNNTRTVLDFFSDKGLYLLGNFPQPKQAYGFNEWDDIWNNPYSGQGSQWNNNFGNDGNYNHQGYYNNQGGEHYYAAVMNDQEFTQFLKALQRDASFDDSKIAMIQNVAQHTSFKAVQVYELVKTLSFDKGKVQLAKELYSKCVDKKNYYQVFEALSFDSSKRELNDYIAGR